MTINATANGTVGGPYAVIVTAGPALSLTYALTNVAVVAHSTYTVGTTVDHAAGLTSVATCRQVANTTCALRDALAYAVSGTDAITFNGTAHGTSTLIGANGPLTLTANVTITGPGANALAIDGGCTGCDPGGAPSGGMTVFVVNGGVTAIISDLTIQHANASFAECGDCERDGGGIDNFGTLTVANSTLSGNRAERGGGIYSHGDTTLTVTNSTFSGNSAGDGGGIYLPTASNATVTNSTFSGNSASSVGGGGINNYGGRLTVANSTFSGNHASSDGGGINNGNLLTVTNSTFSGNSAAHGGGIHNGLASMSMTNSTVTGNSASTGGGINSAIRSNYGAQAMTNTILAGNTATTGGPDINGIITGSGHNLFGTTSGATITLAPGDIVNPAPLLGILGNYGGPTQTVPLLTGSPAIDAGDPARCPPLDQRGTPRVLICDIGAYELLDPTVVVQLAITGAPASGAIRVGEVATLRAIATYADGYQADVAASATWGSSDATVAGVDIAGKATGKAGGAATITASIGGQRAQVVLTVGTPIITGVQPAPAPAGRPSGASAPAGSSPSPAPIPVPTGR